MLPRAEGAAERKLRARWALADRVAPFWRSVARSEFERPHQGGAGDGGDGAIQRSEVGLGGGDRPRLRAGRVPETRQCPTRRVTGRDHLREHGKEVEAQLCPGRAAWRIACAACSWSPTQGRWSARAASQPSSMTAERVLKSSRARRSRLATVANVAGSPPVSAVLALASACTTAVRPSCSARTAGR